MDESCTTGLECRDNICSTPLLPFGESCTMTEECEDGLECRADFGVCLPLRKMAGDSCLFGFECEPPLECQLGVCA